MKTTKSYGNWQSPISAEHLFDGFTSINYMRASAQGLYFIASQSNSSDQFQLSLLNANSEVVTITSPEFNLRTAVHEYGGIPYAFSDSAVYFINFDDQRIYQQYSGTAPKPLTPVSNKELRYADLLIDEQNNRLICVREDHRNSQGQSSKVINTLVTICLQAGGEGDVLYEGNDFVCSPCLSAEKNKEAILCWQSWNHPNMPWDETQLNIASIDAQGNLINHQVIVGDTPASLVQPQFDQQDNLFFIADWSNWWDLYQLKQDDLKTQKYAHLISKPASVISPLASWQQQSKRVVGIEAECASPQWTLGQRSYAFLNEKQVLLSYTEKGLWFIAILDLVSGQLNKLPGTYGELANVVAIDGDGYFAATTVHSLVSIYKVDPQQEETDKQVQLIFDPQLKKNKLESFISLNIISVGKTFSFPGNNDQQCFGIFFPPHNESFQAPEHELPPLIVGIHGGPTSSSNTSLKLDTQFWTSRGFAVVQINHRGSSGFGRSYRQNLYGQWGVYDLEDAIAGVNFLIKDNLVDPKRLAIHGGSAGGYTVMAMLAFHDLFQAGASYYGISDLEALASDTHKFESRYLDQLIGPYPQLKAVYRQRSPLHHVENISAALLILQGEEDKVVPPVQAQGIYTKLKDKIEFCEYINFKDEGHGFRKKKNLITALEAELKFYNKVFKTTGTS